MPDENKERGNWDSHSEYLLSMIGYAVGLGNIWRFPVLAYENGGGGFLIPYVVMLVFAGLPVFFMSTAIGQFCSLGPAKVYGMAPVFRGLGIAMVFYSLMVGIYYNMIIAYSSFYMFASFTSVLPWSTCDNHWNNHNLSVGPICTTSRAHSYCSDFELSEYANKQLFDNLCNGDTMKDHFSTHNKTTCINTFDPNIIMFNQTLFNSTLPELAIACNLEYVTNKYYCQMNDVNVQIENPIILPNVTLFHLSDVIDQVVIPGITKVNTATASNRLNAEQISAISAELKSTMCPDAQKTQYVNSPTEFFTNYAMNISPSINETGSVQLHLVYALIFAWFICYFTIIKGVKSSGKVVWFTALFPYFVLLILVIRGCTLEGAYEGIQYYIGSKSDLTKLSDPSVWRKATTQIFFSLSVGMGGLVTLSSYNKFNNNCCRDSVIVSLTNCATSIFGGFAIFPALGYLSHIVGRPVPNVVEASFGLAFQVYPEAISKMPGAPVWSILFFIMLITLGLDSQFAILETVMTAVSDVWPSSMKYRIQILTGFAFGMFLLGINLCTQSGLYWLDIMDNAAAGWALLLTGLCETIAVSWCYGVRNLVLDIESMIGKRPWYWWAYWVACWAFITPVLLIAILIWSFVELENLDLPDWALAINWLITITGLIFIFGWAIYAVVKHGVKDALKPEPYWGPALQKHRDEWIKLKEKQS